MTRYFYFPHSNKELPITKNYGLNAKIWILCVSTNKPIQVSWLNSHSDDLHFQSPKACIDYYSNWSPDDHHQTEKKMYRWETERYEISVYKEDGEWIAFVFDAFARTFNRCSYSYFSSRDQAISYVRRNYLPKWSPDDHHKNRYR